MTPQTSVRKLERAELDPHTRTTKSKPVHISMNLLSVRVCGRIPAHSARCAACECAASFKKPHARTLAAPRPARAGRFRGGEMRYARRCTPLPGKACGRCSQCGAWSSELHLPADEPLRLTCPLCCPCYRRRAARTTSCVRSASDGLRKDGSALRAGKDGAKRMTPRKGMLISAIFGHTRPIGERSELWMQVSSDPSRCAPRPSLKTGDEVDHQACSGSAERAPGGNAEGIGGRGVSIATAKTPRTAWGRNFHARVPRAY